MHQQVAGELKPMAVDVNVGIDATNNASPSSPEIQKENVPVVPVPEDQITPSN